MRKIIHLDMDAFFASVELRDNPRLNAWPVAVGGDPGKRGVISTASYKARKYGVRSAMPSWKAVQLCPDLVIVHPSFEKYKQESRAIRTILQDYTDLIEPLSLDEAYLDVTQAEAFGGSATLIAQAIRQRIWEERRLTASAGVAPNKFLAKVASDWKKPNGLAVILPGEVDAFVKALSIEKIWGIGKVAARKLHALGIHTCDDLQQLDIAELEKHFGSRAWSLHELCRGIDNRPVTAEWVRKSLSVESTFLSDLKTLAECFEQIPELYQKLRLRFEKISDRYEIKKPFVKIKWSDFTATTAESALFALPDLHSYQTLLQIAWERRRQPVRLIGLGFVLSADKATQLTLF